MVAARRLLPIANGTLTNLSLLTGSDGTVVDEGKTVGVMIYRITQGNGIAGHVYMAGTGAATPRAPTSFLPGEWWQREDSH